MKLVNAYSDIYLVLCGNDVKQFKPLIMFVKHYVNVHCFTLTQGLNSNSAKQVLVVVEFFIVQNFDIYVVELRLYKLDYRVERTVFGKLNLKFVDLLSLHLRADTNNSITLLNSFS